MKGSGRKGQGRVIHDRTDDAPEGYIATGHIRRFVPARRIAGYIASAEAPAAAATRSADDEADQQTDNSASAPAPAGEAEEGYAPTAQADAPDGITLETTAAAVCAVRGLPKLG